MKCYIVRHADKATENFFNPTLHHQDQPISKLGEEEARQLCAFFEQKPIAAIYVSEYQRTTQTITAVSCQHNLSPIIDPHLNELDNGLFEHSSVSLNS